MKHSKSKFIALWAAWMLCAVNLLAQSTLERLDIDVELLDNGDAVITETRQMDIGDEGTELYIVISNLNGSDIRDFSVTDETGTEYDNIGEWDSDRSRSAKTNQCGIITKDDGYELCWGLGDEGEREYTAQYVVTNLVKAYNDADGFNYMFVARNVQPSPQEAYITIHGQDSTLWRQEDVKMWAFGFEGEVNYEDGYVLAESNFDLDGNPMIVMLQFPKGLFQPETTIDDSFETVKQRAFEGSDYPDTGSEPRGFMETIREEPSILVFLLMLLMPFVILISKWWSVRKLKKMANENLLWFRDIPYEGDLQKANAVLNAMKYGKNDYKNLVSAAAIRLISIGALRIEEHFVDATKFQKIFGKEGKNMRLIVIGELKEVRNLKVTRMLRMLYDLFVDASGEDRILQPREFKRFVNSHTDRLKEFMEEVMFKMSVKECKNDIENVRQVVGLKKFLNDFTLANERGIQEVNLWGDYLVYAELFGCADELRKEMKQINPEFLNMDDMYKALFDNDLVSEVTTLALLSCATGSRAIAAESRSSGGGGFSSFGGGGGFSGGGSGGGIR